MERIEGRGRGKGGEGGGGEKERERGRDWEHGKDIVLNCSLAVTGSTGLSDYGSCAWWHILYPTTIGPG